MGKLFNKTYFKFLMGFLAIIALSVAIIIIVGNPDQSEVDTDVNIAEVGE